jgi:hypothetical protein
LQQGTRIVRRLARSRGSSAFKPPLIIPERQLCMMVREITL